jgi:hypothetical protein
MANFFQMTFHDHRKDTSAKVEMVLPPEDLSKFTPPPARKEDGTYCFPLYQPDDDERHIALGKIMDAWSKLEMALAQLLSKLLKLPFERMPPLVNSLGNKGVQGAIKDLAPTAFHGEELERLYAMLDRVKKNATRRNNLAHGLWILEWFILDRRGVPYVQPKQVRAYSPSDAETREKIANPRNRKERKNYMFELRRICAIARSIDGLTNDLQRFTTKHFKLADNPAE